MGLARSALAAGNVDDAQRMRQGISAAAYRVGRLDAELLAAGRATPPHTAVTPWKPEWNPSRSRPATPSHETARRAPVRQAFQIIKRGRWGARPAKRSQLDPMGTVTRITVHHTGEAGYSAPRTFSESISRMRSIQGGHQARWADIGYHWVIDPKGRVFEGREERWQGAHAGNGAANRSNVGIALMGNFDRQHPPAQQVERLEELLRWLMERHDVSAWSIHGHDHVKRHHGLGGTSCPGRHLEPILERIKRNLARSVVAR